MSLTPMDAFEDTLLRARHLIDLYELLHNKRKRRIRSDWEPKAKQLLGWKAGDSICRIDGNDAVLLIKDGSSWDLEHFEHVWIGELLRSAIVSAVSAMDFYLHDLISSKLLSLLSGTTPKQLAQFPIALENVEKMLAKALESRRTGVPATRPRTILKECFRNSLNQQTFQGALQVEAALRMLGIKKCWGKVAQKMGGTAKSIRSNVNRIANRRNKIVHEGDIKQGSRPRQIALNSITAKEVRDDIDCIEKLAKAINVLV